MNNTDKFSASAPPGFKLLAWEGVGLYVPRRWEIGRHEGDHKRGLFRVDDESRVVIQARWWTAERPIPIGDLVRQHALAVYTPKGEPSHPFKRMGGLGLPDGEGDRAEAFLSDPLADGEGDQSRELLVVWQRLPVGRVLMLRFLIRGDRPETAAIRAMLTGLRLQGLDEPRDFAALDFAVQSPAGYALEQGKLKAGVCYLEFRKRGSRIAWRRFGAADAVMGTDSPGLDDLERWCRVTYAAEFYDMRYNVERTTDPIGRPMLRLAGNRRWLAPIELKWLIPSHRRLPRRIDIIWDAAANKIYCLELIRPDAKREPEVAAVERASRMTLGTEASAFEDVELDPRVPRVRSLRARVRRMPGVTADVNAKGRTVLKFTVERPRGLRFLRVLGGLPSGPVRQERSLELDLIGNLVWEASGKESRVCEIIAAIRDRFKISHREAELSVTEFVRALGSRGILAVVMEE